VGLRPNQFFDLPVHGPKRPPIEKIHGHPGGTCPSFTEIEKFHRRSRNTKHAAIRFLFPFASENRRVITARIFCCQSHCGADVLTPIDDGMLEDAPSLPNFLLRPNTSMANLPCVVVSRAHKVDLDWPCAGNRVRKRGSTDCFSVRLAS